jgi:hypothetical protein
MKPPRAPRWILTGHDVCLPPPKRRWFVVFRPRLNPAGWLVAGTHLQIDWRPGAFRLPRLGVRLFRVPERNAP